jgi:hypothetical protein
MPLFAPETRAIFFADILNLHVADCELPSSTPGREKCHHDKPSIKPRFFQQSFKKSICSFAPKK